MQWHTRLYMFPAKCVHNWVSKSPTHIIILNTPMNKTVNKHAKWRWRHECMYEHTFGNQRINPRVWHVMVGNTLIPRFYWNEIKYSANRMLWDNATSTCDLSLQQWLWQVWQLRIAYETCCQHYYYAKFHVAWNYLHNINISTTYFISKLQICYLIIRF